jgi:hypothetical protein
MRRGAGQGAFVTSGGRGMSEKRRAGDHDSDLEALREEVRALRERAERAEGRLSSVVDQAPDGMMVFERDGVPVFANRAMRSLLAEQTDDRSGAGAPAELLVSTARGMRKVMLRVVPAEWDGRAASLLVLSGTDPVVPAEAAPVGSIRPVPDREPLATTQEDPARHEPGTYRFRCTIDEFGGIQSALGPAVADDLLAGTGHRLEQAVRVSEAPTPVADGSFEVVCGGLDETLAELVANRLRRAMEAPTTVAGLRLGISATVDFHPVYQADPHQDAGRPGPPGAAGGDKRDRLRGALFTAGETASEPEDTTGRPSALRRSSPGAGHRPT